MSYEVVKVHYLVPVKQSHALWDAAKCRSEKGMESLALLEACGQVALLIRTITVWFIMATAPTLSLADLLWFKKQFNSKNNTFQCKTDYYKPSILTLTTTASWHNLYQYIFAPVAFFSARYKTFSCSVKGTNRSLTPCLYPPPRR